MTVYIKYVPFPIGHNESSSNRSKALLANASSE